MKSSFIRPGHAPLVGYDGKPVPKGPTVSLPNEVHVILRRPNGEESLFSLVRSKAIYWKASAFIARGGRYAGTIDANDDVNLVALAWHELISDWIVIAEETVRNGPSLADALDRLVTKSFDNMDKKMLVVAT